ncbi:hypothetical protein AVEN_105147-1 [Araneus ventricosus]|uniref:Uncharacterized protein n=1 Tax=Araneus ventricosus TaxID=182803 RepID=A0A4Y2T5Y5_ARAVE|nr:hypothetical protein AVEN_105147-1 [Araneus ventricosus]
MEYAKKMILIPEERADFGGHLSNLDSQMQEILRRKDLPESEKANQYLQMLQKFVKIQHPQQEKTDINENQETEIQENKESKTVPEEEDSVTAKIYKEEPARYFSIAKNILDFLKANNTILTWTPEGEIVYKGQCLPRTNIVKLVGDLLRNRKKSPPRFKEFHTALKEMNIPTSYIINKKLLQNKIKNVTRQKVSKLKVCMLKEIHGFLLK